MKTATAFKNYYVLPCCLLLLNVVNQVINYKAALIEEPAFRALVMIGWVLFGSGLTAYLFAPAIEAGVRTAHRTSRRRGGGLGEVCFLIVLGLAVFWLYYRLSEAGPAGLLPQEWRNPPHSVPA